MATKTTTTNLADERYAELKLILEERRRDIMAEVHERMRDVRVEGSGAAMYGVLDSVESSESDIQDEIEFALIQMKAETLSKIDEALQRLEVSAYGNCFECASEIAEQRLRALPFAVRCKACEEAREQAAEEQPGDDRRGVAGLFVDSSN